MSETVAATRATYAAFAAAGFGFASWASRIPQVKARLGLDSSELGLLLLAIAGGAVIALPLSGPAVTRFGSRRTVAATTGLAGAGLIAVAAGYRVGVAPVVVGLFAFGVATGAWDVAMNVQGATVERRLGRAIMPRFHAGFSLGTVAGALCGAAMVALGVSVTVHLLLVGLPIGVGLPIAARALRARRRSAAGDRRPAAAAGSGPRLPGGVA